MCNVQTLHIKYNTVYKSSKTNFIEIYLQIVLYLLFLWWYSVFDTTNVVQVILQKKK